MEFRVLGPLEVVSESGPVNLGGPQQRRLLAALLTDRGRVLTFDRLVEVLRPDADEPENARRSAITNVSRLRSALGDTAIDTTDAGYLLVAPGAVVDAERFGVLVDQANAVGPDRAVEMLDEALALWRGPVFGDLCDEWWARPFALKMEEQRLTALSARIDAMTTPGWNGRALADAASLVAAYPLREQFVEQLMRGLHASGQTADALRTFQQYRSTLADETGLDPSASLVELDRSMAVGSPIEPSRADLARPLRGYVLRELLGEGSFGAVYRATQPGVGRDVAVKTVRPEFADDRAFIRRFEAEAQLVARLEHPHIVPLYDFWRQPGGAYLVFRYMRGGTGEELVANEGALPLDRVNDVVEQVGDALVAAHMAGVVHRDVKPGNILFDDIGTAYLSDFGIAASLDDARSADRWSTGSALYASPEQLRDGVEDALADQYALAATTWELLTGRPPFTLTDPSLLMDHKMRTPLGGDGEHPLEIPASLAAVLARAGAVHPGDRYADASAFVEAWRRAFVTTAAATTDPPLTDLDLDRAVETRRAASTRSGTAWSVVNPYKGLRAFREADAADFRGRADLVHRLSATVEHAPFTAVVGPSGSGKSSLVLAGLVPALRASGSVVIVFTPGVDPFRALADALGNVARHDQTDLITVAALQGVTGTALAMLAIAAGDRLTLVIDQFEELWTITPDDDRAVFADALAQASVVDSVRVVATIRADFFDRPLADPALGQLVAQHTFGVTPMTAAELHEAVTVPADAVGVRVDPALASRLVAETLDQPGSLPLLQFTLAELFEHRTGATITADAYDAIGGLAGSLSRQADALHDSFGTDDRAAVRRMFARLVVPGDGTEDTRRRAIASELASVPPNIVQAFVDRRLLTTDRDTLTREPTTEVAHEILLRSWPRLRAWLDEDRAWLRSLRGLSSAAVLWDSGGRDTADLYRGARLAVVNEAATTHDAGLTDLERAFLHESVEATTADERAAAQRFDDKLKQNRRLRRVLVGLAAVLAVALTAGGVAAVQRQRANRQQQLAETQRTEAERQRALAQTGQDAAVKSAGEADKAKVASQLTTLASRSLSLRSSEREVAALLAVEAWKRSPDAAAKSALFGTFTFDPGFLGYLATPDSATSAIDGLVVPGTTTMLLTSFPNGDSAKSATREIDVVTGAVGRTLPSVVVAPTYGPSEAVSADSSTYAVFKGNSGRSEARIGIIDLQSNTVRVLIDVATNDYFNLALDKAGNRVAATSDFTGETTVYDTYTGAVVGRIPSLTGPAPGDWPDWPDGGAVAYGPDGRLFVGSRGEHLRVFDPTTLMLVDDIPVPPIATGRTLTFTSATTLVAQGTYFDATIGQQRGSLIRLDIPARQVIWQVSGDDYGYGECTSLAVSAATNRLWCGNYFGVVRERSFATGARTGRTLANQHGWILKLQFVDTPRGTILVGTSNNWGYPTRWQVDGGGAISHVVARGKLILGELNGGKLLVGTPNGGTAPFDLHLEVWDSARDSLLPGFPAMVAAQSTGDIVYGAFADGTVGSYNIRTHEQRSFAINLNPLPVTFTASRDGALVATGFNDGHVDVYDNATGHLISRLQLRAIAGRAQPPAVSSITISDDHRHVYVTGNGLYAFELPAGTEVNHVLRDGFFGVAVAPNGSLAVASTDGQLAIYDPTLAEIGRLPGARGFVQRMSFSADSTLLLGSGNDLTYSLYDVPNRVRLGDPVEVDDRRGDLRSDGLEAASPGPGGVVLTDLDPAHWVDAACAIAGRNLTKDEWSTYIGDLGNYRATCPTFPAN